MSDPCTPKSMRCHRCHSKEATIHFTLVVGGKPQEPIHLCEDCGPDLNTKGVEALYWRVTPEEYAQLQADPKAAKSFFDPDPQDLIEGIHLNLGDSEAPEKENPELQELKHDLRLLFIGTEWHALHFLLTGERGATSVPLSVSPVGSVVRGWRETPWPCTNGHVRAFSPEELRAIAEALARLSMDEVRSRSSVASLNAAGIQPPLRRGCWTDQDAESLFEICQRVVDFFRAAARAGDVILLSFE